jgi:acyl-CoA dehydrogenase
VVPSDRIGQQVARLLITPGAARDRLTADVHLPAGADEPVGALEQALAATLAAEAVETKIRAADKAGRFAGNPAANVRDIATVAFEQGVIDAAEYELMRRRNDLRDIVVRVDDFPFDFGSAAAAKPAEARRAA